MTAETQYKSVAFFSVLMISHLSACGMDVLEYSITHAPEDVVTSRFQKGHLSYLRRTQLLYTVDRRGHFNPVTTDCVKTAQQFVQTVVESCILCITVSQHLVKTCFFLFLSDEFGLLERFPVYDVTR